MCDDKNIVVCEEPVLERLSKFGPGTQKSFEERKVANGFIRSSDVIDTLRRRGQKRKLKL